MQPITLAIRNKALLVTGGAGFLGSALCVVLRESGCGRVLVPHRSDYDLRRRSDIQRMFRDYKPDLVVHLAAVGGGIGANRANGGSFFYENAIMGIELIEQARCAGLEKLVLIGTVCSYPKLCPVPFRAADLWNGYPEETNAPYGLAKKMLLVQAQAYRWQYGLRSIYLLPVNLYGPGDNFDPATSHVIPAIIRKCKEARERRESKVVLWGSGSATREFLYVRDAAQAIALAMDRYDGSEPVNIGSGTEIRIRDLAEIIGRLTGFEGEFIWDKSQPDGQPRRRVDTEPAYEAFGFRAETGLEDGLRETIAWHDRHVAPAAGQFEPA